MPLPKKEAPAGAPEWVLTYGDMMSLLLCFFILLAAMANYEKPDKRVLAALESIREAFGSPGQHGLLPDDESDLNSSNQDLIEILRTQYNNQRGESESIGTNGAQTSVRAMRQVREYQVDHFILFDGASTELTDAARTTLSTWAEELRGYRSKIELRGHCSREPLPDETAEGDPFVLSMRRAMAAADFLVAKGVERDRLRLSAAGPYEPAVIHAYSPEAHALNQRVELFVYPRTVEDYLDSAVDAGTDGHKRP